MASRFKEQRDALAQAAALPQINGGSAAMQAADQLLAKAGSLAMNQRSAAGTGLTVADMKALMGDLPTVEKLAPNQASQTGGMPPAGNEQPEFTGTGDDLKKYVYEGMLKRGIPEVQAKGFMMNFPDESGFNVTAREGVPNVHGTRGFGLYQVTDTAPGQGRETDLRNFAKQNGLDPNNVDTQLDFLKWEISNTEKGAWNLISKATDPGEAGALIVEKFLRPAAKHRIARANKYRLNKGL